VTTFYPGQPVTLTKRITAFAAYLDRPGVVRSVDESNIAMTVEINGVTLQDVACAYFTPGVSVPAPAAPHPADVALAPGRGTKASGAGNPTEAERQEEIVATLRSLGYRVLVTDVTRYRASCGKCSRQNGKRVYLRCPSCSEAGWSQGLAGDPGISDLLVQSDRWPGKPCPTWAVETKRGPSAPRKPEQLERERRGEISIVWDLPSLCSALVMFERSLLVAPLAAVLEMEGNL
jgi:hypothetical protein